LRKAPHIACILCGKILNSGSEEMEYVERAEETPEEDAQAQV
jgi:hypothetical protein